jgi:hypothetical protein
MLQPLTSSESQKSFENYIHPHIWIWRILGVTNKTLHNFLPQASNYNNLVYTTCEIQRSTFFFFFFVIQSKYFAGQ